MISWFEFVKIRFRLEIGDLVDSDIMQLYPIPFAKEMCKSITRRTWRWKQIPLNGQQNQCRHRLSRHHNRRQQTAWAQPMMGTAGNGSADDGRPDDGTTDDGTANATDVCTDSR